jgi:hypothetical protein
LGRTELDALGISITEVALHWRLRVLIESDDQLVIGVHGAFAYDTSLDTALALSADFRIDNNSLSSVVAREGTRGAGGKAGCIWALLTHHRYILHRFIE